MKPLHFILLLAATFAVVLNITSANVQTSKGAPEFAPTLASFVFLPEATTDSIKTRNASCSCGQLTVTYVGPDPERRALCQCNSCKLRTGSVMSASIRVPSSRITVKGKSTAWTFPEKGETVAYRSCDSGGVTYHFCPVCGSTVYWDITFAPGYTGVGVGAFTDPTFPEPNISGFEEYKHPWTMNVSALPMPGGHHN
jgi:hypothetical protein